MNRLGTSALAGLLVTAASAATALGCGGDPSTPKAFSTDWLDDQGKSIAQVQARLAKQKPPVTSDLVVAVAGNGDKVVGIPLGGASNWTYAHALDARPVIAGNVVLVSGGSEVVALDAATGRKLWARPTGGSPLLGAGDDGDLTALTLGRGAGSTLLVVGRDGAVKRQIETTQAIGDPAVVSGVVFVPWANQYVSAIDPTTGDELGRVVVRDKVSRALTIGGDLYFGELAYVRFDDKIVQASRGQANRAAIPTRELPGTPRLLVPGTERLPAVANARDRDRLFARPVPASSGGGITIDNGRFYASYFRLVFGFEASRGQLAWVHTHPTDLIGGEAVLGGVLLCTEDGKIVVLDAKSGQVTLEKGVGEPIKSCVVEADTFRAAAGPGAPALGAQIAEALSSREATLATAQRLLLRELTTIDDEASTKTLVDIASDPRSTPVLASDARAALASRRSGAGAMRAALAYHYDFLRDVLRPPPVAPLADALAAMKDTSAAPLLAAHLLDPANSDEDVKHAAQALAVLATEKEAPALKHFFAMYRASAESEEIAVAVGSAAEALVRVDRKDGRKLVEGAARDTQTNPAVRARLDAVLSATPASEAGSGAGPTPSASTSAPPRKPAPKN